MESDSSEMKNRAVGLLIVAVGVFLILWEISDWRKYSSSVNWEKVDATIENLKMMEHIKKEKKSSYQETTGFSIEIEYSYEYKGTKYVSDKFDVCKEPFFKNIMGAHAVYKPLEEKLKKHEPIEIIVNPNSPKQSAITRTDRQNERLLNSLIGVIIIAAGIGVITKRINLNLK